MTNTEEDIIWEEHIQSLIDREKDKWNTDNSWLKHKYAYTIRVLEELLGQRQNEELWTKKLIK
jgi:hypothetical protein